MVRIALLDDNKLQLDLMHDLVEDYAVQAGKELAISDFSSGTELTDIADKQGGFDIYLLDIIMPDESGMDVAERIRRFDKDGKIVFITATSEYALASYDVRAFNYLLKPIDQKKLFDILEDAVKSIRKPDDQAQGIVVRTSKGRKAIGHSEIMYVDMHNRILGYHLLNGEKVESATLRVPFKEAVAGIIKDPEFAQIGVSTVVALREVVRVRRDAVTLKDGTELLPSRASYNAFRDAWEKYWNK